MKHLLRLTMVAAIVVMMTACGNNKLKVEDLKKAEATLFNDDMTANKEAVPEVVDLFCQYVNENPEAEDAPNWLFKALEIAVGYLEPQKAIEIGEKLFENYPDYDKTPVGMFMLGTMVYEDKLGELGKAKMLYEKLIADYPDSEFAPVAQQAILNLGKTPEEIIREFEEMNLIDSVPEI